MSNMTTNTIRIGNGAGFWGDNLDAPRLLAEGGQLDYLTLEYLAELTLSILAHQRSKDPSKGFVTDVPLVVSDLAEHFSSENEKPLKLVTNGGGMNPRGCAVAVAEVLVEKKLPHLRVAAVTGDDLLPRIAEMIAGGEQFEHFETGEPLGDLSERLVSANAYLGAKGITRALDDAAQIVITGRVADASLVVGPAVQAFGWSDWPRLGAATVAGHLIECGAQVTGGMYSDWTPEIALGQIGYPIVELREDGSMVITKASQTDGQVSIGTVSEQLVYEIGDPKKYMTPDVVADFTQVRLTEVAKDRVLVEGGTGTAAPETLKVSIAYSDGFTVTSDIVIVGPQAVQKAKAAAAAVQSRLKTAGFALDEYHFECLGAGATLPRKSQPELAGLEVDESKVLEVVLRISGRDSRREAVQRLSRELTPLVTAGPPGVTGYTGNRPRVRRVLSYWPTTISRELMEQTVEVQTAQEWVS